MSSTTDYIIVGQGIAGTVLAMSLQKKNKKIVVIDDESISSCSRIAGGMYNPIVFKRLVKSWMANDLLPFADAFYTDAEKFFNKSFYHKRNIVKFFTEQQEIDLWNKKAPAEHYLSPEIKNNFLPEALYNSIGYSEVKHSGNLDMGEFINLVRNFLKTEHQLIEEKFDHALLKVNDDSVEYKNIKAKKIIFCEGYKAVDNPYFNWLPFKLTKGELLTVHIKNFPLEKVINKTVGILPMGNFIFKVGATYGWDEIDEHPSTKGETELLSKLKKLLKLPFEIVDHRAGVRPTVKDRRPLIGLHPDHKSMGVFNGLGTKGVMLAPYFAEQFIAHLETGKALHPEVDIERVQN